jgi:transcriptional regulator with GAF, ATPase, and Fis domain
MLPELLAAGLLTEPLAFEGQRFDSGTPYLLMTLAQGVPLSQWPGDSDLDLAWAVARDVGQALADLHRAGLAHGDIKPDNVIVRTEPWGLACTVVDLGLADTVSRELPQGGTRRYLAPETFAASGPRSGRSRDLYALGLCILEAAVPAARTEGAPASRLGAAQGELRFVVEALLDPNPAARPSADWVASQCPPLAPERQWPARVRRVEQEYLLARREELARVEAGDDLEVTLPGTAGSWLRHRAAVHDGVRALKGVARSGRRHAVSEASEREQRSWLLGVVGQGSLDFPRLPPLGDDALADRLLELCTEGPLETITYGRLARIAPPPAIQETPRTLLDVALELGAEAPSDAALAAVEKDVAAGASNPALQLRAARLFKRQNQLARALGLLRGAGGPRVELERSSILLRAGDVDRAVAALRVAEATAADDFDRSDCAAQRARIALSRGERAAATRALEGAPETVAVLEAGASVALAGGELGLARTLLERALGQPHDAEQRARIEASLAHLEQREGDSEGALARFQSAAEHAARARAILEEATYLVGVSSTATVLGRLDLSLAAARRSELLFEYLGQPAQRARAVLATAASLATAGALVEARSAALRCLAHAEEAGDEACKAFACLVLTDVDEANAEQHLSRAERWLAPVSGDDVLRLGSRKLRLGLAVDVAELDARARSSSVDVELEWWATRAERALAERDFEGSSALLDRLSSLSHEKAAPDAAGPAMAFGAQLAAEVGAGDTARRLVQAGAEALRRLAAGTPPELALSLAGKNWVKVVHAPREDHVAPEQVTDLARLIHGLSEREHLKPLCDRVLDALVLWTGVERGLLLLRAPGGKLVPRAARNVARKDLNPTQVELSRSLAERALERAECVVAADAQGELPELHHSVHALKLRSVMAVPLIARGETLGVVYLDDRVRRGAFGPRELAWVKLVAALAAVAIADARDQLLLKRTARRATRAERRLGETLAERDAELDVIQRELATSRAETRFAYPEIRGDSAALRKMLSLLDRVTPSEVPVLITGESGSGKELVARALATNGPRGKRPFVSENCSAIPETLLESTLFGHVRGAFTGASHSRIGLFQAADGGTLFLDEIADMSLGMQAKLLRAVQNGEIRRVGDERSVRVDVRVIAATHKDLTELARTGKFRADLLYRLDVIRIDVPPLRDRIDDIVPLVEYFLEKHGDRKVRLSRRALELLRGFAWPGNVRQLENEVRRAMVLCDGEIRPEHLSPEVQLARPEQLADGLHLRQHVDALEARLVERALNQTDGNQTQAAKLLGLSRFGLQKMMKRLGIEAASSDGRSLS